MKRLTAILLTLSLALCALSIPASAEAASGTWGDNLTWNLDSDGKLTVSGNGWMDDLFFGSIQSAAWFEYAEDIKSVVISEGVTSIAGSAFHYCTSIENVSIPNTVTYIGQSAFRGCTSLKSISIPNSVTEIEGYAFSDCSSLVNVVIPDSVTEMGWGAFYNCTSLTSITLPDGIEELYGTFSGCTALKSLNVPAGVKNFSNDVISGCRALETLTVSKENKVYHSKDNCVIETETNSLIAGCKNSVIPDYVTDISYGALSQTGIKSINIPASVVSIAGNPFYYNAELESITVDKNNKVYRGEGNCVIEEETNTVVAGCSGSVIPKGVTAVGECAFSGCTFTSFEVPEGVISIGQDAFSACSSLKNITLHEGLKSIDGAFAWCSALESLVIPDSVTEFNGDFQECFSIESFTIGAGIKELDNYTFINYGEDMKDDILPQENIKTVYVRSAGAAAGLTSKEAGGNLMNAAETVILASGIQPTDYIKTNYPYTGTATIGDEEVTWYRKTEKCTGHYFESTDDGRCAICGSLRNAEIGDANGDGAVNNIDASFTLQYDSGLIDLEDSAFAAADVDGNGAVNNIDASRILQLDAGIISEF